MLALPGVSALVLYQLKAALDKLQKRSNPVGLNNGKDGVHPLPNLGTKAPKPQFDAARARLFEAAIRTRAENPNDALMRKHLARFEIEFQNGRDRNANAQHEAQADLLRQQLESRDLRLYARQQEARVPTPFAPLPTRARPVPLAFCAREHPCGRRRFWSRGTLAAKTSGPRTGSNRSSARRTRPATTTASR
jgi:hypothetical protein